MFQVVPAAALVARGLACRRRRRKPMTRGTAEERQTGSRESIRAHLYGQPADGLPYPRDIIALTMNVSLARF